MTSRFRQMGLALLLIGGLLAAGGCQDRLRAERDALFQQNQELQDQLELARQANDALVSENSSLESELVAERNRPAPQPVIQQVPTSAGANAFAGIEGVETIEGYGTVTVRVPGDVLFASGKVDLRSTAKRTLDQIASAINREYPGNTVRIEGYTDSDPIRKSKWKDNLELSLQRAAAVHRYLQSKGIDDERMYAAGFGPAKPQATKAKSRRVEIVVVTRE